MKIISQETSISGPNGNLEAILDLPDDQLRTDYISVNCHPHSLHGGTMTNKVVYTVSRSLAALGIPSIRFNFRGVGKSDGVYDEGKGEIDDLEAVVNWMKQQYSGSRLILTGFSFGSFVAGFAAVKLKPDILVSVAPPVKRFDFEQFIAPENNWLVIIGDQDELVDYDEVKSWVEQFKPSPRFITMTGASHFFHGRLVELRHHVETGISELIKAVD